MILRRRTRNHAICIKCGSMKRMPLDTCGECGVDPKPDDLSVAKSILLSDSYFLDGEWHRRSREELQKIAESIRAGAEYPYRDAELEELLDQKKTLDTFSPRHLVFWFVRAFWPGLLIIPLAILLMLSRIGCL